MPHTPCLIFLPCLSSGEASPTILHAFQVYPLIYTGKTTNFYYDEYGNEMHSMTACKLSVGFATLLITEKFKY